ncbi:MAG: hypothetical protein Q7S22_03335 [Candidatus Micrarchaeota archaeon]|nr:hypothetical protein [Candidatus Micrarchaeota archaeon]
MKKEIKLIRTFRAQASTEYLVILAVILVIALTVVLLFMGSSSIASDQKEKLGQVAWEAAYPISVDTITWTGSSLSFYVKNNDYEKITIKFMRFSPYSAALMNVPLLPQQRKQIAFGVWPSCPGQGQIYSFNQFYFLYDKGQLVNISQQVNVPYAGRCM